MQYYTRTTGKVHDYVHARSKLLRVALSTKPRTVIDFVTESGLRISRKSQSKNPSVGWGFALVEPRGLKPRTSSLPAKRSNQLSYGPMFELL